VVPQRIFVDADVLASRTQYLWLTLLREEAGDWFQLHSSSDVVVDAVQAWVGRDPVARADAASRRLESLAASLDEVVGVFADIGVPRGVSKGASVHDAAATGAHVLLTSQVPDSAGVDDLPFEIYTPDQFFCFVDDGAASRVRGAARQYDHRTRRPARGGAVESLTEALAAADCPGFAERVSTHLRASVH